MKAPTNPAQLMKMLSEIKAENNCTRKEAQKILNQRITDQWHKNIKASGV